MLRKVSLRNFKGFEEETFELPEHLVMVGPNNCGKTSLLQAIATWSEIANHWFETNPNFARDDDGNYPAADLNLLRFDAVPLPDFSHLWRGKRVAAPVSISVETAEWRVGLEITHSATEFARVRPLLDVSEADLRRCRDHRPTVVHVPPISRLAVEEQPLTESGMKAIVRRLIVATHSEAIIRHTKRDDLRLLWGGFREFPKDKTEYWLIAAQMLPEEVHPEVLEKLDGIANHFGINADAT